MRTIFLILTFSIFFQGATAQINQSATKWREDLRFLQETVHQDYSFLFKKISENKFDDKVEELYQSIPEMEDHQVVVGLARMVALFGYGHTSLRLLGWEENIYGFRQMPFNLYYFSDGIYLQGVHQQYENALGAKVLKVEDIPVLSALDLMRPVVPVENEQFFKAFGVNYLGTPEILHAQGVKKKLDSTVELTLEKDGLVFKQIFHPQEISEYPLKFGIMLKQGYWLDARDQNKTPLWLKNMDRVYYSEYIMEEKSLYVRHSQIQDDDSIDIPTFYNNVFDFIEKNPVDKLILDLRLNSGGNNYKNKPIVTGIIACEKINAHGKLFVVLGRRTYSACQNLVNELDSYTNATFVGEPTGENINFYGDNRTVTLPNSKIPIRLSFAWWQDKPQWENATWLAPDLAVDMSFEDYQNNQDPVLESIWAHGSSLDIVEPLEYLTELFLSGQEEMIFPEAKRLAADIRYRYYPFQERLNQTGYNLLNNQRFEPALMIFQLNTVLFPQSANTWDSLAEAYWRSGDTTRAIELYKKSISIDPDGRAGENSRRMLNRIKEDDPTGNNE